MQDLDLTDILLLASVGIFSFKVLMERICNMAPSEPNFITAEEFLLLLGFLAGCTGLAHFQSMLFLLLGLALHIIVFHLKSSFSLISGACFCIISGVFYFPAAEQKCNPFCISAFVIRLSFPSVVDLYFSRLSLLESWKNFILQSKCYHRLQVLVILMAEMAFYTFCVQGTLLPNIPLYKLPLFVFLSVPWVVFHFMFIITTWGFVSKLEECASVLRAKGEVSDNNISEIMAAKGIRHFCLVSQIVTLYTLVSTVALSVSVWQETNPMYLSFLLIILPIESAMYDILSKLGKCVGGTAIGYALIAPAHRYSPSGNMVILPEDGFQAINSRAIELVNVVSRFFANHMIHNYGTDFSTNGIAKDYVSNKVQTFFSQRVLPGLHYDTYILYYSGHVLNDGKWALTEGNSQDLDTIIKWWRERNAGTGARLILFLDTAHSDEWLKGLWLVTPDFVAIQTGKLNVVYDEEIGNNYPLGELTKLWEDFNSEESKPEDYWGKKDIRVKPIYGVSKNWCCFKFHEPTVEDITQHVEHNFPRFMKPVTKVFTHLPCNTNVLSVCNCVINGFRRLKMKWFLPAVYDTGHGFKLVR
ncbi:predicted protein [Nematostella vectensis]|uniref:Transmembrane protein 168 n=1 Tax=Nematostella vectensis TaxID=45351 RepID=A7RW00_NEMVE|nr:predicted protein [Nematostella vectensis]|eukprot:XP_001636389.1 predicted protein [Nematostella vectensis]